MIGKKEIFLSVLISLIVSSFVLYSEDFKLPPSPPFEDNLKPNDLLTKATLLATNQIRGPETISISKNGNIYTGLVNGQIVEVMVNGSIKKIAQLGILEDQKSCDLDNSFVKGRVECGRPMGNRLVDNFLYVADAFAGIYKIDIVTGEKTLLISNNDPRFGDRPLKFTNDLDIDGDIIYFIDTSYLRDVNQVLEEHIEAQPRGRLFSLNEKNNQLTLLLDNLYFPNGVQLMPDKKSVLVNENTIARIIRWRKKGKKEVFADLPGFSDSIRLTEKQTLLVPFGIVRYSMFHSILDLFGKFPKIRDLIVFLISPDILLKYSPKYGLLVEYDLNGNILRSWHDQTGKVVQSTSAAALFNNKVYIGSLFSDFIAVVDY